MVGRHTVFVGFSTPKRWNPLSWLIRLGTGSRASHSWLLVEDPLFKLRLVLEAHATGFRLVPLSRFAWTNRILCLVVPQYPLDDGLPQAGQWLGERFDVLGLLGMAWVVLGRLLMHARWKQPFPSPSALFCSESVVRTLQGALYQGSGVLDAETTTPHDLLEFFRADGSRIIDADRFRLTSPRGAQGLYSRESVGPSSASPGAAA